MFKKAISLLLSLMLIVTSLSVTIISVSAADGSVYKVAGVDALTGDGPKNTLAAPLWTADKKRVLNALSHYLKDNNIYQGKDYEHRL